MKLFLSFVILLFAGEFVYSQEYFINETDGVAKVKFPFKPDWSRNFVLDVDLTGSFPTYNTPSRVGFLFARDTIKDSDYGFFIDNLYSKDDVYQDAFMVVGKNVADFDKNSVWQPTTLLNNEVFNKLQIYKIENDLFFLLNGQVVCHIPKFDGKGDMFYLAANKRVHCNSIQAYYMERSDNTALKNELLEQQNVYATTGMHYKIAQHQPKAAKLELPKKTLDGRSQGFGAHYLPEYNVVKFGNSLESAIIFDGKTGKEISNEVFFNDKKPQFYNNSENFAVVALAGQPVQVLENYYYVKALDNNSILLDHNSKGVYSYNYLTKKFKRLIKSKSSRWMTTNTISDDNKYIFDVNLVYNIETGEKIDIIEKKLHLDSEILSVYDDNIIVENGNIYQINLITKVQTPLSNFTSFQGKYKIHNKGRTLDIYDMSEQKFVVKDLVLLIPNGRKLGSVYYSPTTNEVFLTKEIKKYYSFSDQDDVLNINAYLVNTISNEITPFQLGPSESIAKNNEASEKRKALAARNDALVNDFVAQFKTFGGYYELDYDNLQYVDLTGNELLKKNNIGGTIYGIGKFCSPLGADILIVRVRADQYSIELLSVKSRMTGISVSSKVLGVTQNVNGYTTELTTVKVNRNSTDKTQYTMQVNDSGKITNLNFTSDCK